MFWKSLDGEVCDPISLQPICEFASEPFLLGKTYFDPEILAHYLISTALFVHPTTREEISRDDCIRLDRLLGRKKVIEAYDLLRNVNSRSKKESEAMRREATQVFQQLFVFRSQRHRRPPPPQQRKSRGGGFMVVDDDEERFAQDFQQQTRLAFDLERDFPKLFEKHSKPQLARRLAPAVPRGGGGSTQLHGKIVTVVTAVAPVTVDLEEEEEEPSNIHEAAAAAEEEARARIEEAQFREQLRLAKRQQARTKPSVVDSTPVVVDSTPVVVDSTPIVVDSTRMNLFWFLPITCLLLALVLTLY